MSVTSLLAAPDKRAFVPKNGQQKTCHLRNLVNVNETHLRTIFKCSCFRFSAGYSVQSARLPVPNDHRDDDRNNGRKDRSAPRASSRRHALQVHRKRHGHRLLREATGRRYKNMIAIVNCEGTKSRF